MDKGNKDLMAHAALSDGTHMIREGRRRNDLELQMAGALWCELGAKDIKRRTK